MEILQRPKSGVIVVEIDTAQGKRRVSTGTTDPDVAQEVIERANLREIEIMSKVGAINQALVQKLVIGGKMTVQSAATEWKAWMHETCNSDRTEALYSSYVDAWMRDQKIANHRLCNVTERDINAYVNDPNDPAKYGTRARRLSSIRQFLKWCEAKQYLIPNPSRFVQIKHRLLSHEQMEKKKILLFTDNQIRKIEDYLTMEICEQSERDPSPTVERKLNWLRFWYCAVIIGRYSGLRLGDIASLEKASLSEPGKIVVWTRKRRVRVDVPVCERLQAALDSIPPSRGKMCFPLQDTAMRNIRTRSLLSVQFSRILEACNITGHSFHGLRHTLAHELNIKGSTLEDIAEALGHRNTKTTEGYTKH